MRIKGFPPIGDATATTLILGSMPSVTSLHKREYYGHPSNDFWPIISAITQVEFSSYQDKIDAIIAHRIVIWDVLQECSREMSKDSTIQEEKVNDFESFFYVYPHINKIITNGKKAYQSLQMVRGLLLNIPILQAVSTSRAYPLSFDKKLSIWASCLT